METINDIVNGVKYRLSVDESLTPYSEVLFRALRSVPANAMRDGYKFEIGFSVFICVTEEDGYRILAPDYINSPFINTTEDLTIPLWIMFEQVELLNKYGVGGIPTRFDDEIVIADSALDSRIISMQRYSDLGKGASGWCIEAVQENEDGSMGTESTTRYESIYAYQLLQKRASLIKALVLPYDYLVVFDGDEIGEILNENDVSIMQ